MWNRLGRTTKDLFRCHSLIKRVSPFGEKCLSSECIDSTATRTFAVETVQDLREKLINIMGIDKGYNPVGHRGDRANLQQYLPINQKDLPERTMMDSFVSAKIPLSTDLELKNKYITFSGRTRIGRLLEDMDIFAVYVALKHTFIPNKPPDVPTPYTLVTVLVDEVIFTDNIRPTINEDIRISGHVTWIGKSSIEVAVVLEQNDAGQWRQLVKALFLMAARNSEAGKAAIVNALKVTNEKERSILDISENRKKTRSISQSTHVLKVIPTDEEQQIVHDLFLKTVGKDDDSLVKTKSLPEGYVWMEQCTLSNLIYSHPEHRNLHNAVFGGFIMRHAIELSWALGLVFSKSTPSLRSINNISFQKSISVGSLIRMVAHVAYTENEYCQITIFAEVLDSQTGKNVTTNAFNFTYKMPGKVPIVIPRSYQESLMYIEGRRQFLNAMKHSFEDIKVLNNENNQQ